MKFKKKVVAIIQARMGSERLPGKVLLPVGHKPALQWCVERVQKARTVDDVIVATTTRMKDMEIIEFIKTTLRGVWTFRGSEDDVLSRVITAAEKAKADYIVEITADCPFIDPTQIDDIVLTVKKHKNFYGSNVFPERNWPDGFDIQVYPIESLRIVNELVKDPTHRCHVGWNITNNITEVYKRLDGKFNGVYTINPNYFCNGLKKDLSNFEVTLDTKEDLKILNSMMEYFYIVGIQDTFTNFDIIRWLINHPQKKQKRKIPGEG